MTHPKLKGPPIFQLIIEPSVILQVPNPNWHRNFKVVERVEKDQFLFFRCEWTEPDPEPSPNKDWKFVGFGVAHIKGTYITETWVISTMKGIPVVEDGSIESRGMQELVRHKCLHCHAYVIFQQKRRVRGPECVEITNTCPKCGHKEVDVLD
jgi:hypothetical protein